MLRAEAAAKNSNNSPSARIRVARAYEEMAAVRKQLADWKPRRRRLSERPPSGAFFPLAWILTPTTSAALMLKKHNQQKAQPASFGSASERDGCAL
jgi:hypothetical protein